MLIIERKTQSQNAQYRSVLPNFKKQGMRDSGFDESHGLVKGFI